jgi:Peptidase_C39 like family
VDDNNGTGTWSHVTMTTSIRMSKSRYISLAIAAFVLFALHATAYAEPHLSAALIKDVPHVKQKPDFCGEACVEMVLKKLGFTMDQDYVFDQSGLDPALGRGCYAADLAKAMKSIGFDAGVGWYSAEAAKTAELVESQWKTVHADLTSGIPSIVCTRFDESPSTTEHFRLILGYDPGADMVIYHDPAIDGGRYLKMDRKRLLGLWPLKSASRSTVIRFRCKSGIITNVSSDAEFSPADYAQSVIELKKITAGKDFSVVVEPPFLVTGDGGPAAVSGYASRTVRWAVDRLKQAYFKKNPKAIITIWLFKDKESYENNTRELFSEEPTTPYGFYSDSNNALIMNISTGGGTLVHEIVHPFIAANFPGCPAWFNEGLGSLYEQSSERGGQIIGLTNWRLAGLQQEIAAKGLPSFYGLIGSTSNEFYSSHRGDNYAQARYLCYYLQERGLLVKFYHEFYKNRDKDSTGTETLKKVLGESDLDEFKTKWEKFVQKLKFP